MRPVTAPEMRAAAARPGVPRGPSRGPGPGPSKVAYRLSRLWKKAWLRRAALAIPAIFGLLIVVRLATAPAVHAFVDAQRRAVLESLSSRPEFAIRGFRVTGASEALSRAIAGVVRLPTDASSLTLDVDAVQARVAALGGVRSASVTLGPDGMLLIAVDERIPEALWRDTDGTLWLVGREGVRIGPAGPRADHPSLPVVIGQGAPAAMQEALDLFRSVPELHLRLRAFVRVGERRWNVVLDRDMTIKLPAHDAEAALARVMALQYGEELLDRDLTVIDMRLGARPTLRMSADAMETMHLRDAAGSGPGKET